MRERIRETDAEREREREREIGLYFMRKVEWRYYNRNNVDRILSYIASYCTISHSYVLKYTSMIQ